MFLIIYQRVIVFTLRDGRCAASSGRTAKILSCTETQGLKTLTKVGLFAKGTDAPPLCASASETETLTPGNSSNDDVPTGRKR